MDQQTRTLIELRNVDLHYDRRSILKNLTFSIKAGEFVLIYGSTGTGKSTLCRLLAGLIRPNNGQLFLAGDRIDLLNEVQLRWLRRSMGLMTQEHSLLPDRSVLENIMLPALVAEEPAKEARLRALQALNKCGLEGMGNLTPSELSVGQRQLACLARAVVNRPVMIIADEPLAQLDKRNTQTLLALLSRFANAGVTVIITSHRQLPYSVPGLREISLDTYVAKEEA